MSLITSGDKCDVPPITAPGLSPSGSEIEARFRLHHSPSERKRAIIIGGGFVARTLAENLVSSGKIDVVGFIDRVSNTNADSSWPILGDRDDTEKIVAELQIDIVYVAYAPTWQQQLAENLSTRHPQIELHAVPNTYEAMLSTRRVFHVGEIAIVPINPQPKHSSQVIRRVLDFVTALIGLAVLFPLWVIISIAVKVTSRGPVLFAQDRTGKNGIDFKMFKFRTMVMDAEQQTGPVLSSGQSDQRLTVLGRWLRLCRVDEIPQLLNVLRGEMSIVGPRPERPCFVRRFETMIPSYARRHDVRPGITGLAQICGGYHTDARDKLRFDLIYVANQSFGLDISILLRTLLVVILPKAQKFNKDNVLCK